MQCYYCDVELTWEIPNGKTHYSQVKNYGVQDHVFPKCLGGDKVPNEINLVYSCHECNEQKNGTHPLRFYHEYDFSNWNEDKINDFMWRVKAAIIIINSSTNWDVAQLYHAKEPEWYRHLTKRAADASPESPLKNKRQVAKRR